MGYFGKDNHYYHKSIRNYTVLFGSIFDDMYIQRTSDAGETQYIKVPLQFGRTTPYESVPQDSENRERKRIRNVVPCMSFSFEDFNRDENRTSVKYARPVSTVLGPDETRNYQNFSREPWNITFKLSILTKNIDDMLQIIEQIIPVFKPTLTIPIQDVDYSVINQDVNIVITLESIQTDDNFDSVDENRAIEYTLTFLLKGFIHHKIRNKTTINQVDIHYFTDTEGASDESLKSYFDAKYQEDLIVNSHHYDVIENVFGETINSNRLDTISDPTHGNKRSRKKNN